METERSSWNGDPHEPGFEDSTSGLQVLLAQVEAALDALDGEDAAPPTDRGSSGVAVEPDEVTGAGVDAADNRMVRAARARLARGRSEDLRERFEQAHAQVLALGDLTARPRDRTDHAGGGGAAVAGGPSETVGAGGGDPPPHRARRPAAPTLPALAASLRVTTGQMRAEDGVERVLRAVVDAALASVPDARHAGILTVERGGHVTGRAPTDPLAARADQLQVDLDEGPGLQAARRSTTILVEDLRHAHPRWPTFVPHALDLGLRSTASIPVIIRPGRPGVALTLYAERPSQFGETDVEVAQVLAVVAARALDGAFAADGLRVAMDNRDVIGQAKGMLMLRHDIDADQAFTQLREASQAANIKLVDVARWFVAHARSDDADRDQR